MNKLRFPPAFFWVFLTVILQIMAAIVLAEGSQNYKTHLDVRILGLNLFFALSIHGVRFFLWGVIHKRYDLSSAYPLIAVYFPLIYLVAIYRDEADWGAAKVIGSIAICTGIFLLSRDSKIAGGSK